MDLFAFSRRSAVLPSAMNNVSNLGKAFASHTALECSVLCLPTCPIVQAAAARQCCSTFPETSEMQSINAGTPFCTDDSEC
eukprot:gnl/Chilomastix_caulleri/1300.p1 GENE.gnl/Chilomastix_caulleri/1300~~gnl/Chilomastix_caulleri/1300.p1  ORF type:complete len:81 (-),score=24.67 gnl/Chilomastix_caulleri/1300:177-419(-)